MVQIVIYSEAHEVAVITLWREIFGYTAPHNDPAFAIRQKLQVQPELFLVAMDGDQLVGTVMGGYDGHRGWIYSLAVRGEHQRKGIGTLLVRAVEQALKEGGCPKVNLQVLATNAAVVEFYKRLGYAVEERVTMGKLI